MHVFISKQALWQVEGDWACATVAGMDAHKFVYSVSASQWHTQNVYSMSAPLTQHSAHTRIYLVTQKVSNPNTVYLSFSMTSFGRRVAPSPSNDCWSPPDGGPDSVPDTWGLVSVLCFELARKNWPCGSLGLWLHVCFGAPQSRFGTNLSWLRTIIIGSGYMPLMSPASKRRTCWSATSIAGRRNCSL